MPFITIQLREGRTLDQKRQLVEKITDVVSETAKVPKERVYVFIEDLTKENFGKNGKLWIDEQ